MNSIKDRAELIAAAAKKMGKDVFKDDLVKNSTPRHDLQRKSGKVVTLEEAIKKSGLKDGMTISFHHHFRGGDKVINMVVDKLAEMGFKNLHLASSSLIDVHKPLIEHIKNGVITKISTSGLRGDLATEVSHGLMDEPVVFRSHGSRGYAIATGELHIDVAFLGASSCDPLGNAAGFSMSENAKSICGSLGYALPDAKYADKTVILTDDLVDYPNQLNAISEADVDFVVVVDSVGDSSKISSGAIRDTKNPRDILLAKKAAKVVINSGYFENGFSLQTGSGGASLAVTKYLRQAMIDKGIKARFALGGITSHMVKLHQEGLIDRLIDVQSFDKVAAESLMNDPMHKSVSANEYAALLEPGSATHFLDVVILSALATVSSAVPLVVTPTLLPTQPSQLSFAHCFVVASHALLTRLPLSSLLDLPLMLWLLSLVSLSTHVVPSSRSVCKRLVSKSLRLPHCVTKLRASLAKPLLCPSATRWLAS